MDVHLCVNVCVFVYVHAGDECMRVCMQVFMCANVHVCTYMYICKSEKCVCV